MQIIGGLGFANQLIKEISALSKIRRRGKLKAGNHTEGKGPIQFKRAKKSVYYNKEK